MQMRTFVTRLVYLFYKYSIILIIGLSSSNVYATDYTIGNGTTQTSRVTLTNSDTLTVDSGGEIDYSWPAVDADNRTFSSDTTTFRGITQFNITTGIKCIINRFIIRHNFN